MFKFMNLHKLHGRAFMDEAGEAGEAGGAAGGEASGEGSAATTTDWRSGLAEEFRDNPSLKDFKDINGLAKSFIDTKSAMGQSIRIPSEDAGDEARSEFTNKLLQASPNLMLKPNFDDAEQSREFFRTIGMPEDAADYQVPEVEGSIMPAERVDFLRGIAHEEGITGKQFSSMMQKIMNADVELVSQIQAQQAQEIGNLQQEWGAAYNDNVKTASVIAAQTGAPDGLIEALSSGNADAATIKWLHSLSTMLGPEGQEMVDQHNASSGGAMTPAEAKERISEIMNNKEHPYWKSSDPQHKAALDKMIELQRFANPSGG